MDSDYKTILIVASSIAIALVPLLVMTYRQFLVKRRLKDLHANLWNKHAIEDYVRLFGSGGSQKPASDDAMKEAIKEEFFRVHSLWNYFLPIVLLSVVTAGVVITIGLWAEAALDHSPSRTITVTAVMSLAGAYIWALYEILTRIRSQDLTPVDLSELTLRLLAAIPIGYAFSLLALDGKEGLFAFIAASFPLRDVKLLMRQKAMKKLELDSRTNESRVLEGHLGRVLDGLSDVTLARLEELGIITYMDLAYTNPVRLMARTGYSLRHILAWIDQALLAVYAPSLKVRMSQLGVPCSLDAYEFYEAHCWDPAARCPRACDEAVVALASGLGIAPVLLIEILREVYVDPHVRFLNAIWYSKGEESAAPEEKSSHEVGKPADGAA
jgi:hypothetical protein